MQARLPCAKFMKGRASPRMRGRAVVNVAADVSALRASILTQVIRCSSPGASVPRPAFGGAIADAPAGALLTGLVAGELSRYAPPEYTIFFFVFSFCLSKGRPPSRAQGIPTEAFC